MATLSSNDITIAVTVYDRRTYLRQAIASALEQTRGSVHQVMVVEDSGPDDSLREFILGEFGDKIRYYRNTRRRGLFDNWNACIEHCSTRWLCILHDDDFLEPKFIEAMQELAAAAPARVLYYGVCRTVDRGGRRRVDVPTPSHFEWREMDLESCTRHDPVCFPGQLFNVEAAREVGGFRPDSHYCADWEMWFRLAMAGGAAGTNRVVANYREHHTLGRGTTKVDISGRKYAYVNMQRKRHVAWLRKIRPAVSFDRAALQSESPMPTRFLLKHAHSFSPLMLKYNVALLARSAPPHLGYRIFQSLVRLCPRFVLRRVSQLANLASFPR